MLSFRIGILKIIRCTSHPDFITNLVKTILPTLPLISCQSLPYNLYFFNYHDKSTFPISSQRIHFINDSYSHKQHKLLHKRHLPPHQFQNTSPTPRCNTYRKSTFLSPTVLSLPLQLRPLSEIAPKMFRKCTEINTEFLPLLQGITPEIIP